MVSYRRPGRQKRCLQSSAQICQKPGEATSVTPRRNIFASYFLLSVLSVSGGSGSLESNRLHQQTGLCCSRPPHGQTGLATSGGCGAMKRTRRNKCQTVATLPRHKGMVLAKNWFMSVPSSMDMQRLIVAPSFISPIPPFWSKHLQQRDCAGMYMRLCPTDVGFAMATETQSCAINFGFGQLSRGNDCVLRADAAGGLRYTPRHSGARRRHCPPTLPRG